MTLLFQYSRKTDGSLTPIIPVTIKYGGKEINVRALIDSGADYTFIPEDVAGLLGIKYHRGRETSITGIDKELKCTLHHVTVTLFDGSDKVVVRKVPAHVPKLSQKKVGVLIGRRGLLDEFELTLNAKENAIKLERQKSNTPP